jgi:predicted alpha/beta-fold hydrolase
MSFQGHLWTIRPFLQNQLRPRKPPPSEPWSTEVEDPTVGPIRLQGRLSPPGPSGRACLVIVHGLGGSADSAYVIDAALAAEAQGLACLRLNLRGADGDNVDFYNAGLTADVHAALKSPALAAFEAIYLLGYSLGGHIVLRAATETEALDPRVRAVAAICPPLDLDRGCAALDQPRSWVYRRHILAGLKDMYAAVAARRRQRVPVAEARRITRLREWDDRIVAPRFGHASAEAYYAAATVVPRLAQLGVPSLLAAAAADPMVPADTLRPALVAPPALLDVRWIDEGGHVGFPGALALGFPAPLGLEPQAIQWLLGRGARERGASPRAADAG